MLQSRHDEVTLSLLCQSLSLPDECLVCQQIKASRLEKYAHHDLSLSLWNV